MPEEINRIVTDSISDALWTPSEDGDENLRAEGVAEERISRVGNIMLDSYELMRPSIESADVGQEFGLKSGLLRRRYAASAEQRGYAGHRHPIWSRR